MDFKIGDFIKPFNANDYSSKDHSLVQLGQVLAVRRMMYSYSEIKVQWNGLPNPMWIPACHALPAW